MLARTEQISPSPPPRFTPSSATTKRPVLNAKGTAATRPRPSLPYLQQPQKTQQPRQQQKTYNSSNASKNSNNCNSLYTSAYYDGISENGSDRKLDLSLHSNSVNARESRIPYPWLVFNEKIKVNSSFLQDSTAVSDSVLLLFGGSISRGKDGHLKMLAGYLEFFIHRL